MITKIEYRATTSLDGNTLTGIAHMFGQQTQGQGFVEEMKVGAFDEALKFSDARATIQHDLTRLLGRQSSGTLRVEANDVGLNYSIDLPDTTYANDLKVLITRGDVKEMSFGFIPGKVQWSVQDGVRVRSHVSVKELVDISPVAIPAFQGTSIQMRGKSYEDETLRSQLVRIRHRTLRRDD